MATHLIDLHEGVWDDDYDRFFEARCTRISEKLAAYIKHRPIDDAGRVLTDDDIDPDAETEEQGELEYEALDTD
jgi:hypothetical protein